jgi:hypothetical protein
LYTPSPSCLQAKWEDIIHLGQQDSELHTQLTQLGQYSTQLFDALASTTQLCHHQLQAATLPALDGVAVAASSCKQGLGREEGAVQHLPLAALPLEHSSGDSSSRGEGCWVLPGSLGRHLRRASSARQAVYVSLLSPGSCKVRWHVYATASMQIGMCVYQLLLVL